MKRLLWLFLVILCLAGGYFGTKWWQREQQVQAINSFDSCAKLFPVMDSYPPRCVTSDKRSFTQNIGNELELRDEILISSPRPNQVIHSPLRVTGKAVGSWFFEASFTAELFDANNHMVGKTVLRAQGDWMTTTFVPFAGALSFEKPQTATGTLKIKNANPSGDPQRDKILTMPVKFD